jgi:4'-phosphopantetheinyl transferase
MLNKEKSMLEACAAKVPLNRDISCFDWLFPALSAMRMEKIKRYIHREDSLRALTGDWLARKLISDKLQIPLNSIRFSYDEYGKPHFPTCSLSFNISHSGKWVTAAMGTEPLGIDVELVKPLDLTVAHSIFSPPECVELLSLPPEERLAFFFRLWTIKESLIKAVGQGLSLPLTAYTVTTRETEIFVSGPLSASFYFRHYMLEADYPLTICSRENHFPDKVTVVEFENIHNHLLD